MTNATSLRIPPAPEALHTTIHCGLWKESSERVPPELDGFTGDPDEVLEVEYVNIDSIRAEF